MKSSERSSSLSLGARLVIVRPAKGEQRRNDQVAVAEILPPKGEKLSVAVGRHGIVLCGSEAVVHEPTVANRIDRVVNIAPGSSLASLLPLWSSSQKIRRRTHEFPSPSENCWWR